MGRISTRCHLHHAGLHSSKMYLLPSKSRLVAICSFIKICNVTKDTMTPHAFVHVWIQFTEHSEPTNPVFSPFNVFPETFTYC